LPGAETQNASIRNRTFYGGVLQEIQLARRVQYVIAAFGSKTEFENPFITNFEVRNENNIGGRTWLEWTNRETGGIKLKWNLGAETQYQQSRVSNYGNRGGNKDTVQAIDLLSATQGFAFTRFTADLDNRWLLEGSVSYNFNRLAYARKAPIALGKEKKLVAPEFMPRLAASYMINRILSLRAIISRGYSPPTLQEIRSFDNSVNTALQAESGWNYEAGLRLRTLNGRLWWDASVFYYKLDHAIIQQVNAAGQTYFVNA
jgi:iron complex outermembrane receptor protein